LFGNCFIAVSLFFFSFTTVMAYYYIAECNVVHIKRSFRFPGPILTLKVALMGAVFYGTVKAATTALKDYEMQRNAGVKKYTFDPKKLGIKNADFWEK
jgi:AGCS family alanine or glycine:cation symporter